MVNGSPHVVTVEIDIKTPDILTSNLNLFSKKVLDFLSKRKSPKRKSADARA